MKPGRHDVKLSVIITGDELHELKRFTIDMVEAFGLDRRIEAYTGKRPNGLYRWDVDCLLDVIDNATKDRRTYPEDGLLGHVALERLRGRLAAEYRELWK